jgi:predicted nucleic acid-binding protein
MKREFEIIYQEIETIEKKRLLVEALYSNEISFIVVSIEEMKEIIICDDFRKSAIIRQAIQAFDKASEGIKRIVSIKKVAA